MKLDGTFALACSSISQSEGMLYKKPITYTAYVHNRHSTCMYWNHTIINTRSNESNIVLVQQCSTILHTVGWKFKHSRTGSNIS